MNSSKNKQKESTYSTMIPQGAELTCFRFVFLEELKKQKVLSILADL